MLDVEFRIKNYRCFGDEPTIFRVRNGFTALVGTNNSGKSSLLRFLYEIRPLLLQLSQNHGSQTRNTLFNNLAWSWAPIVLGGERILRAGSDRPVEIQIIVHDGPAGGFSYASKPVVLTTWYDREHNGYGLELRAQNGTQLKAELPGSQEFTQVEFFEPFVAAIDVLAHTMYIGPFRNAIHVGSNQSYYDIQTGNAFIGTFSAHQSGQDFAANEATDQMTEELRRIFSFESLKINPAGDTLQLMIDGRSFRLSEQGAGFAHFVVVMMNVLVRQPKLLLIDEPELNLHASLQQDFLTTLTRYTEHGVIFATHSLGLARSVSDYIYTLAKPVGKTSSLRPYEETQDLVTLLGQLSFDGRPEMGFSRVLLVEGKTELRALMQFLRLYGKEHEVLMISLHGTSLINGDSAVELNDLLRVGGDVQYLIDSERATPDAPLSRNHQGFVELCEGLGISGLVLKRRALENYFTDKAVKRVFGDSAHALEPYEIKERSTNKGWAKTDNWRVAAEMSKSDLDGTDLGDFLEAL